MDVCAFLKVAMLPSIVLFLAYKMLTCIQLLYLKTGKHYNIAYLMESIVPSLPLSGMQTKSKAKRRFSYRHATKM